MPFFMAYLMHFFMAPDAFFHGTLYLFSWHLMPISMAPDSFFMASDAFFMAYLMPFFMASPIFSRVCPIFSSRRRCSGRYSPSYSQERYHPDSYELYTVFQYYQKFSIDGPIKKKLSLNSKLESICISFLVGKRLKLTLYVTIIWHFIFFFTSESMAYKPIMIIDIISWTKAGRVITHIVFFFTFFIIKHFWG